jgi:hypothetical protein
MPYGSPTRAVRLDFGDGDGDGDDDADDVKAASKCSSARWTRADTHTQTLVALPRRQVTKTNGSGRRRRRRIDSFIHLFNRQSNANANSDNNNGA